MSQPINFFPRINEDRRPHEVALEWLLAENLKPGDEIMNAAITDALGMCNPDDLGSKALHARWDLARMREDIALVEKFEERTGLTLLATRRGYYRVPFPEELSGELLDILIREMNRALRRCLGKLGRAKIDGISHEERERRSRLSEYANNVREFMNRKRRKSITDETERTPPGDAVEAPAKVTSEGEGE